MNSEPPSKSTRWPLLRVQAGHSVELVLLSGDWVRLSTHFFKRTFLCAEVESCEACSLLPSRSYWYLPSLLLPAKRLTLVEFSSAASSDLEQHAKLLSGGLSAGLRVTLSRRSAKSPVRSEVMGFSDRVETVALQEWVSPLMAIYGLPPLLLGESVEVYGARVHQRVLERAAYVADVLKSLSSKR